MAIDSRKFQEIKDYLWRCPADFWIVYSVRKGEKGPELKWHLAASTAIPTRENCSRLAEKYKTRALNCFKSRGNKILREFRLQKSPTILSWIRGSKVPSPSNAEGKRWWHLIIGSGAVHDAGYVIVTRVAAKDPQEMRKYIADIQGIVEKDEAIDTDGVSSDH